MNCRATSEKLVVADRDRVLMRGKGLRNDGNLSQRGEAAGGISWRNRLVCKKKKRIHQNTPPEEKTKPVKKVQSAEHGLYQADGGESQTGKPILP